MYREFSHITFVVEDLDRTLEAYDTLLHLDPSAGIVEDIGEAILATIHLPGLRLEFLEPDRSVDSQFVDFLDAEGEGVYSYCLVIDDFDAELDRIEANGAEVVRAEQPDLFPDHALRLAWILPGSGLGCRVELVDKESLPESELAIIEGE